MDHDDIPIGRLLTRREALALLGAGSAGVLMGCGASADGQAPASALPTQVEPTRASTCLVRPEQTEGPFFGDSNLNRADLRTNTLTQTVTPGVPLALTIGVSQVSEAACLPLENAVVDLWHCDAQGAYSGFRSEGTEGSNACRGFQKTDASGEASFVTVYPGWYRGRAVHLHLKVRTGEGADAYEFTSQLYLPDDVSDQVYDHGAYARAEGDRIRNADDGIFRRGGGDQLVMSVAPDGDGYAARFDIGLDLSDAATGASDGFGRRG